MSQPFIHIDPASVAAAVSLVAAHGVAAPIEAARRADESRDRGNVLCFCHWRAAGRLAAILASEEALGTIH